MRCSPTLRGRAKSRHELQGNTRHWLSKAHSLPSYSVEAQPLFGISVITSKSMLSNRRVQRRVVWEAHETADVLLAGISGRRIGIF